MASSQNMSIPGPSFSTNAVGFANNLTIAHSGAPKNMPLVVQIPQAHLSSQLNPDPKEVGVVTNTTTTLPVSSSEALAVSVQNSDPTNHQQQKQLIAAAMASMSTSIPNAVMGSQQASPSTLPGNKSAPATMANSIYQGKIT